MLINTHKVIDLLYFTSICKESNTKHSGKLHANYCRVIGQIQQNHSIQKTMNIDAITCSKVDTLTYIYATFL